MNNLSTASIRANIAHYQNLQKQFQSLLEEAQFNEAKFQELLKEKEIDQTK